MKLKKWTSDNFINIDEEMKGWLTLKNYSSN